MIFPKEFPIMIFRGNDISSVRNVQSMKASIETGASSQNKEDAKSRFLIKS